MNEGGAIIGPLHRLTNATIFGDHGGMKKLVITIGLAWIAYLVVHGLRPDVPVAASVSDRSEGPSFEVHVVKPLSARPLFGLLPDGIFGLPPNELRLDHFSSGAEIARVDHHRLELRADGWDLLIETDGDGEVVPGTRLVFPIELAERHLTLSCQPEGRASDHLGITTREGSGELDGSFLIKLATCENTGTGKTIAWPPRPLTLRGSFTGLPEQSDEGVRLHFDAEGKIVVLADEEDEGPEAGEVGSMRRR